MKSSVAKQIEDLVNLDAVTKGSYFQKFFRAVVILIVVLLALGFYTRLPPYFMVAAFLGLFVFASRRSAPHLKNAARASTEGQKKAGSVKVEKVYDSHNRYTAAVIDTTLGIWHFSFVATAWEPIKGEYPATLYYLPDIVWPVLVEVKEGIMVPDGKPTRSAE
jgi:hypothetical protein